MQVNELFKMDLHPVEMFKLLRNIKFTHSYGLTGKWNGGKMWKMQILVILNMWMGQNHETEYISRHEFGSAPCRTVRCYHRIWFFQPKVNSHFIKWGELSKILKIPILRKNWVQKLKIKQFSRSICHLKMDLHPG